MDYNDISPIPIPIPINNELEQYRKEIEAEIIRRLMIPSTIINKPFDTNYSQAILSMISFRSKGVGIPDQNNPKK